MLKIIRYTFLVSLFITYSNLCYGTHAAGMDITYECVGTSGGGSGVQIVVTINTQSWGNEISWTITTSTGTVIASGGSQAGENYYDYTTYNYDICITDTCSVYNLILYDQSGNGWNYCSSGASATLTDPNGNVIVSTTAQCCWSQQNNNIRKSAQARKLPTANTVER